ncbi:MAG TPA: hypothetical protein PKK10_03660 [Woeseiaceae bacterium]|nr:hypothetical protein [Woeseiaceae bacterium]
MHDKLEDYERIDGNESDLSLNTIKKVDAIPKLGSKCATEYQTPTAQAVSAFNVPS